MSDLDNILDSTLDDLADLPSFQPYAAGAHKVLVTMESAEISAKMKKPCVETSFKYVECLELANPQDEEPKAGDEANTLSFLDNEFGQGAFKAMATPLAEALGCSSLRDVIDQCKGIEVVILTSIQTDKKDPDKKYLRVKELQVV